MTRINIEIPGELHKKAKIVCAMQSKTLRDYIILALKEKISKEKTKLD